MTNENYERIHAFDVVRGFAVILMIIMHTGLHEWTGAQELEGGSQQADPMMGILIFFLTIAGVYSGILGAVNSFMFYKRMESRKNSPKQLILFGSVLGSVLIGLHFVFRYTFSGDSGALYYLIKTGTPIPMDPFWVVSSSALTILGLNTIIVPILLRFLIKKEIKDTKFEKVYLLLFYLGCGILLATLPLRLWLAPIVEGLIAKESYFLAWILGWFVFDNFPIFPMTAYACFGAILGIALARKEDPKRILHYTWFQAIFWFIAGFLGLFLGGGLHPDLIYEMSRTGLLEDFFRHLTQLGMVFIFFGMALGIMDFCPEEKKIRRVKGFRFISRYGMISLTAYITEALFSGLINRLLNAIPAFMGWNDNLGLVVLLGVVLTGLWGVGIYFWERAAFKFSIEWWILQLASRISGKRSEKYNLERLKPQQISP